MNDHSSVSEQLKGHSCPNSQFTRILVENISVLNQDDNKQKFKIPEAPHIRELQLKILKCL